MRFTRVARSMALLLGFVLALSGAWAQFGASIRHQHPAFKGLIAPVATLEDGVDLTSDDGFAIAPEGNGWPDGAISAVLPSPYSVASPAILTAREHVQPAAGVGQKAHLSTGPPAA